jgi:hypothetical protein
MSQISNSDTMRQSSKTGGTKMTKNFGFYMLYWLAFGAVGGLLTPVVYGADEHFWPIKAQQVAWGLLFGAICGMLFTILQNTWNKGRSKMKSRVGAVGIWMGAKFAWAGAAALLAA